MELTKRNETREQREERTIEEIFNPVKCPRCWQFMASATIGHNSRYTGDIAFNTQPGHIPLRARVIAQNDRAFESLNIADRFQRKADSLRHVRVAGDAETKRQALRDFVRSRLEVGMEVDTCHYGRGIVKKINKKTATISNTGMSGTYTIAVDLSFISTLAPATT